MVVADELKRGADWESNVDPDATDGVSDVEPIGARDELIAVISLAAVDGGAVEEAIANSEVIKQ